MFYNAFLQEEYDAREKEEDTKRQEIANRSDNKGYLQRVPLSTANGIVMALVIVMVTLY